MQIRYTFTCGAFAALFIAGISALAAPAQAQLVTNGGFENYVVQSDGSSNYFTGWTLSGNVNQGTMDDTFVFFAPHSGDYAAWLGPVGSDGFLSQTLATTPGTTYTVSYWLAVDSQDSVSGASTPNDFSAALGGQTLFNQTDLAATDGNADPADDYTLYSFTTVASSASSVLQFGFRDDNSEFRLDDVSVTPAAVPEASTTISLGLLLALGTGAAVWKTRRRVKPE